MRAGHGCLRVGSVARHPDDLIAGGSRSPRARRILGLVFWWGATLAVLLVLDDLTIGPLFWALAGWQGRVVATVVAFVVYAVTQIAVVVDATRERPSRATSWFLRRLDLQRRSAAIAANEARVKAEVVGGGTAVLVSPLIGGVIPPLVLGRQGFPRPFVRRVGVVTSIVYAGEFAFLHGWIPGTIMS